MTAQGVAGEDKARLLKLLGYGRLKTPVWFLGMEERGGGEARLLIQSAFEQVEDLRDAHIKLRIPDFYEGKRKVQPTWNLMCEFMLRI